MTLLDRVRQFLKLDPYEPAVDEACRAVAETNAARDELVSAANGRYPVWEEFLEGDGHD